MPPQCGPFQSAKCLHFCSTLFPPARPFVRPKTAPRQSQNPPTLVCKTFYISPRVTLWWCVDDKKRGIVASRTRCSVPPTLKSPIDGGFRLPCKAYDDRHKAHKLLLTGFHTSLHISVNLQAKSLIIFFCHSLCSLCELKINTWSKAKGRF